MRLSPTSWQLRWTEEQRGLDDPNRDRSAPGDSARLSTGFAGAADLWDFAPTTDRPYLLERTALARHVQILTHVQQQLGHAKPLTTWRYYASWIPTSIRWAPRLGQRWADALDSPATGTRIRAGLTSS